MKFKLTENDEKKYADFKKIVEYRKYKCEPLATVIEQKQALLFLEKVAKTYSQSVERDKFLFNGYRSLAKLQGAENKFKIDCQKKYTAYGQSVFSHLTERFHNEPDRDKKFQIIDDMWNFSGYSEEYCGQLGNAKFAEFVGDFLKEDEKCNTFFDLGLMSKDGCYALAYLKAAGDEQISKNVYAKIKNKSVIQRLEKITGLSNQMIISKNISR